MLWGFDMDITLREFIAQRLQEGDVIPSWVERNINELNSKVAEFEKGIGISVDVPDQIALTTTRDKANNGYIGSLIVPKSGRALFFYGIAETAHTEVTMTVKLTTSMGDALEKSVLITENPQQVSLDWNVYAGDVISFLLQGTGAPEQEPPAEEPVPDFTNISGTLIIKLPEVTYTNSKE